MFQTDTAITALQPRPPGRREVPEALLMGLIRRGEVGEGDRQKENVIGAFNNRAAVAAARLQLGGFRLPYCVAICGQLGERERSSQNPLGLPSVEPLAQY